MWNRLKYNLKKIFFYQEFYDASYWHPYGFYFLAFCGGIGAFVLWPVDPGIKTVLVLSLLATGVLFQWRRSLWARFGLCIIGSFLLTHMHAHQRVLYNQTHFIPYACGIIEGIFPKEHFDTWHFRVLSSTKTPELQGVFQLRAAKKFSYEKESGDPVCVSMSVAPFKTALLPGGYDASWIGFVQKLQGQGVLYKVHEKKSGALPMYATSFWQTLRKKIQKYYQRYLPREEAALAIALVTGERSDLTPQQRTAFTDAGVAHVLAISGLHLNMVGFFIFVFLRTLFVLSLQGFWQIWGRNIAAIGALIGAYVYYKISGESIPTQRALMMFSFCMGAFLFKYPPLTVHFLMVAAWVLLLWDPFYLFHVGFQMSFLAVTLLVYGYQAVRIHPIGMRLQRYPPFLKYVAGIAFSTLLVSIGMMPLTAFYFQKISMQFLLGNLLVVPVLSICVMPLAFVQLLFYETGLAKMFFPIFEGGLRLLLRITDWVSQLPGAVIWVGYVPVLSVTAAFLSIIALLFFPRSFKLYGGIGGLLVALVLWTSYPKPKALLGPGGKTILCGSPEQMVYATMVPSKHTVESWVKWYGRDSKILRKVPLSQKDMNPKILCSLGSKEIGVQRYPGHPSLKLFVRAHEKETWRPLVYPIQNSILGLDLSQAQEVVIAPIKRKKGARQWSLPLNTGGKES